MFHVCLRDCLVVGRLPQRVSAEIEPRSTTDASGCSRAEVNHIMVGKGWSVFQFSVDSDLDLDSKLILERRFSRGPRRVTPKSCH